jgi:hypothetical protein
MNCVSPALLILTSVIICGFAALVERRPWWWLLFATSLCIPIQVTFGILAVVLVPHDIANLVGDAQKARYLGITVTMMMVVQVCVCARACECVSV